MIDFRNAVFVKLKKVEDNSFHEMIAPFLTPGETVFGCYKGIRDGVAFTSKRIMAVNIQGLTGKKKDFTSLPYSNIQAFSIETAGHLDLDAELELWFSSVGRVRFEFSSRTNVNEIHNYVSERAFLTM